MAELQDVLDKLDLVNDVKLEIKDVISTDSLHFEDYPNLIAEHLTSNPSEQTIADRTTANGASIKDGVAFLKALKGNSIKWNQHYKSNLPSSYTQGGVTITSNADGSVSVVGQNTTGGTMYIRVFSATHPSGHKMLLLRGSNATLYDDNSTNRTTGSNYMICTSGASIALYHSVKVNVNYNETFIPLYFDLTEMGMADVTSADQFAQRLGFASANDIPSFPYDEGSIKHFSANEIVSKGRNIWDGETLPGYYNAITGVYVPNAVTEKCTKNAISVVAGESYYIKHSVNNIAIFYDGTNSRCGMASFSSTNGLVVAPSNAVWMMVDFGEGDISNTYIERGTTAHGFAPYMTPSSLPLPSTTLYSAGTARDELDLAQGKLTRRIGVVDMGTLNWSDSSRGCFRASLPDAVYGSDYLYTPNAMCALYEVTNWNILYNVAEEKKFTILTNYGIMLRDTTYANAAAFKTAMSGVLFYYEIVTPTTTDIDKSKAFYKVENGGREQVDVTTSSPLVATIAYEH